MQTAFLKAQNYFIKDKDEIIANLKLVGKSLGDAEAMNEELTEMQKQLSDLVKELDMYIKTNSKVLTDQEFYAKEYNAKVRKYDELKAKAEELEQRITTVVTKQLDIDGFIRRLKQQKELVTEFDEKLWGVLLYKMTVYTLNRIVVTFRGGVEIEVSVK